MIIAFWTSFFIVFYTYLGYGVLLYVLVCIRRLFVGSRPIPQADSSSLPSCTLVVAAYNEEEIIRDKVQNTLSLDYPEGKLDILFITDGSDDRTPEIISEYPQLKLMHLPVRKGKVAALHRAVEQADSEIIIFTDANTLLNTDALKNIARHYSHNGVGAVAGEKRIRADKVADAGTAGEGFYWKYESILKKWDSELYSVVGAAGELFSIRRSLYDRVPDDTILDDFMISMLIAEKGHRIVYEPEAYAVETASENTREELKRKIRIAAGGMQSILRLIRLLNIFRHGILTFQYISHRVLRWTITPFLLPVLFILNLMIVLGSNQQVFVVLLSGQISFYLLAFCGSVLEKKQLRIKLLFIPYYFCLMNYAVLAGIYRYYSNNQSSAWEKAKRKK